MPLPQGIYFEYKPAEFHERHGKFHAYLVFRDSDGNERIIRGGVPDPDPENPTLGALTMFVGGDITVQTDIPLQDSKDAYKTGETSETRHARKLDLGGRGAAEVWREMTAKAAEIGKSGIDYNPFGEISREGLIGQTSNSVIRAALEAGKINPAAALPQGLNADDFTGYKNNLANPQGGFDREKEPAGPGRNPIEGEIGGTPGEERQSRPGDSSEATGDSGGQPEPSSQNIASAENSPAGRRMMSELLGGEETVAEILRKPAAIITKPEIDRVIAGGGFQARGHRDAQKADDLVTKWFQHVYNGLPPGAGEASAEARIAVNATPTRLPEGGTVTDAAFSIGREVLQTAPEDDAEPAILRFQESLNAMAGGEEQLRLDSVFGPKTNGRLRSFIARDGFRAVRDGVRVSAGGGFVV